MEKKKSLILIKSRRVINKLKRKNHTWQLTPTGTVSSVSHAHAQNSIIYWCFCEGINLFFINFSLICFSKLNILWTRTIASFTGEKTSRFYIITAVITITTILVFCMTQVLYYALENKSVNLSVRKRLLAEKKK